MLFEHDSMGSFFNYMESVIMMLEQFDRIGTANNYRAALNSFARFRSGVDIHVQNIRQGLVEEYQSYLWRMGLAPNSVSFYMRILRAVYNRAAKQGLVQDCKPFSAAFTGMEKTRKRAISIEEIGKIKHLDLSLDSSLEYARDIFLFLFYCRGISFVDAAFLKKNDVKNGILSYRRHKTRQLLRIKVIEPISNIIDRYNVGDASPYLLPIITTPEANVRKQYETALRRENNALKTIAQMAGLQAPLSTYVARHSWATIAKSKNVPVGVITDALGHDSILTTQIYLASIDTSAIDAANELVIGSLSR